MEQDWKGYYLRYHFYFAIEEAALLLIGYCGDGIDEMLHPSKPGTPRP